MLSISWEELEQQHLMGNLPQETQEVLHDRARINGDTLLISCKSAENAAEIRQATFIAIAAEVQSAPDNYSVVKARFHWKDTFERERSFTFPLLPNVIPSVVQQRTAASL